MLRFYFLLIMVSLCAAFYFGQSWVGLRDSATILPEQLDDISRLKQDFLKDVQPLESLDLTYYYPTLAHQELLKPSVALENRDRDEDERTFSSSENCQKNQYNWKNLSFFENKKFLIWEQYRCRILQYLPENFFTSIPFLHPSGFSYAYLALKFNKNRDLNQKWFNVIDLFHIQELHKVEDAIGKLPSIFHYLASIDEYGTVLLEHRNSIIMTNKYVFFPYRDLFLLNGPIYLIYRRDLFENYIESFSYVVAPYRSGKSCLLVDGQICWNLSVSKVVSNMGGRSILLFASLLIFIGLLISLLFRNLSKERNENEKRKMALRILGHELRTPIASLVIAMESLMKNIEHFNDEMQESLLAVNSNIHRLRRLVEMSRNYLNVQQSKNLVQVHYRLIESINNFLQDVCEEFEQVSFTPLVLDRSFYTDEYWLMICVKNLLNNALHHGLPPVELKVSYVPGVVSWLEIKVIDQGKCDFETIEEMVSEFVKGKKSEGSGLGLNIVAKVLKNIGGELSFHARPTTFTIRLRERYDNKDSTYRR